MELKVVYLDDRLEYEDVLRLNEVAKRLKYNPEKLITSIKDNFKINIFSESEDVAYVLFDTEENLKGYDGKRFFLGKENRWKFNRHYMNGKKIMEDNKSIAAFFDIDKENLLNDPINIPLNPRQLEEKIGDCYKNIEKDSSVIGVPKKINNIPSPLYLLSEKYPNLIFGELRGGHWNIIQGGQIITKESPEKANIVTYLPPRNSNTSPALV